MAFSLAILQCLAERALLFDDFLSESALHLQRIIGLLRAKSRSQKQIFFENFKYDSPETQVITCSSTILELFLIILFRYE